MDAKITLKDIGGYDYQKREAKKIIDFFLSYDKYVSQGAKLEAGIFYYGVPGNGKTMFANAIANESKAYVVNLSDFDNEEDTVKRINKAFVVAKEHTPSIIIIDEIDQMVFCGRYYNSKPSDKESAVLQALLTNIDNVQNKGVLVIATANVDIDDIPSALVRNGRIEKHIAINKPDLEDRYEILKLYLSRNEVFKKIDVMGLANITKGLSCSALCSLVNEVLVKMLSSGQKYAKETDFNEPLQVIISDGIKNKEVTNNDYVIYHEIGHFICDYVMNKNVGLITSESYGKAHGFYSRREMMEETDEIIKNKENLTYQRIFNECVIKIGGLIATEVMLNERYIGASSDIDSIYSLYNLMAKSGLLDTELLSIHLLLNNSYSSAYRDTESVYIKEFSNFLSLIMGRAREIIENNKEFVNVLFKELKEKKTLIAKEVQEIVDKNQAIIHF